MTFEMTSIVLLVVLLAAGLWTVMTSDLLRSAIGLALSSAVLCVILFHLGGPLAAVFELSVCAGLITVVFISTISLTKPQTAEVLRSNKLKRLTRFIFLPLILAVVCWYVCAANLHPGQIALPIPGSGQDVRQILWSERRLDLVGQILIILAGVFGVVVLFKTKYKDNGEAKK
jgi:NADH-quinone oxidoreductase subunit J